LPRMPEDPIIDSLLRTGYPPWFSDEEEDGEPDEDDEEAFYGNETEDF